MLKFVIIEMVIEVILALIILFSGYEVGIHISIIWGLNCVMILTYIQMLSRPKINRCIYKALNLTLNIDKH